MPQELLAFVKYAAKAAAAFVTPFIMLCVAWVSTKIGFDFQIQFDEAATYIAAVILAAVQALWVYFQKNADKVQV